MLNIYFAAKFENRFLIKCMIGYLDLLTPNYMPEFEVTSKWVDAGYQSTAQERANMDFIGVDNSNLLIAVQPLGHGGISEMSYALGKKIPVICIVEESIWSNDVQPEWGWANPLPTGKLCVYDEDFDIGCPGYIVDNIDNLMHLLNRYANFFGVI